MTVLDGRALVAAYLKELRLARGVEQEDVAARIGVHKNTVFRSELVAGKDASGKLETAIAIARALGGDIAHVVALRAERIPDGYPIDRIPGGLSVELAADVARWHVEQQDRQLAEDARRQGAALKSTRDMIDGIRWTAFSEPGKVLQVWL